VVSVGYSDGTVACLLVKTPQHAVGVAGSILLYTNTFTTTATTNRNTGLGVQEARVPQEQALPLAS